MIDSINIIQKPNLLDHPTTKNQSNKYSMIPGSKDGRKSKKLQTISQYNILSITYACAHDNTALGGVLRQIQHLTLPCAVPAS